MTTKTDVETTTTVELKKPRMFKVVYLNDDYTTMDFVIQSLIEVFNLTEEAAQHKTAEIHDDGSSVVAILPGEIAEHKALFVIQMARKYKFPLVVKVIAE